MILQELLMINKSKYSRVFIVENSEKNLLNAKLVELDEELKKEKYLQEAKDYYLLDHEGMMEIFLQARNFAIGNDEYSLVVIL